MAQVVEMKNIIDCDMTDDVNPNSNADINIDADVDVNVDVEVKCCMQRVGYNNGDPKLPECCEECMRKIYSVPTDLQWLQESEYQLELMLQDPQLDEAERVACQTSLIAVKADLTKMFSEMK